VRLVARALAGGDHLEAAGARPVDLLADQRRLVAPGEAVDHARRLRPPGEQRPGERVRLDVDHDDVLAVRDRGERVADARLRDPGRLDDYLDLRTGDQRRRVVADVGTAGLARFGERGRRIGRRVPAGGAQLVARPRDIEVGDAGHVHAGRAAHLGEKHGAELAGADQPDGDGPAGRGALEEFCVQVHGWMVSLRAKRSNLRHARMRAPRNDRLTCCRASG
jgi:hypothetical protein